MEQKYPVKLRREREYRGWSRNYVAEQVGVDLGTIGRWERGKSLPHPHYRQKLCELFGKNAQELGLIPEPEEEERPQATETDIPHPSPGPEKPPSTRGRRWLPRVRLSRRTFLATSILTTGTLLTGGVFVTNALLSSQKVELIGRALRDQRSDRVNNVLWSPDQKFLGVATDSGYLAIWDVSNVVDPKYYQSYYAPSNHFVNDMSWSNQSSLICAACADYYGHGALRIWSFPRGVKLLDQPMGPLRAVAWSPKDDILAYAGDIGSVDMLDIRTPKLPLLRYQGHGANPINSVRWSPDGGIIASADEAGYVHIWNAATGQTIQSYQAHLARVIDLSWSPDGKLLASASEDATVQIWDPLSAEPRYTYKNHINSVHCVCWSHTQNILVSGGIDRTARVWQWNGDEGRDLAILNKHTSFIHSVCWNPENLSFALGCQYEGIELWKVI